MEIARAGSSIKMLLYNSDHVWHVRQRARALANAAMSKLHGSGRPESQRSSVAAQKGLAIDGRVTNMAE